VPLLANEARFFRSRVFYGACSLQNEVGDPPVFGKSRLKKCAWELLGANVLNSEAPATARKAAKRSLILIKERKRKQSSFSQVTLASGIARECVRTTTAVTESRNMAAILQKIGRQ